MSEIIDSYELELIDNIRVAADKIGSVPQTKQQWKQLRVILTQCEKGIKLIQTQLVGQPAPLRAGKTSKLRDYKKRIAEIKRQTFQKQNNWQLEAGKKQLMGHRQVSNQVIKTYDRSTQATQRLRESVKVMYQNLEISDNVTNQLAGQTTKLINSKKKVQQIRHELGKSERKIKSMMVRIKKNKFVLRGVIIFILLVVIVVLVSYFR